MNIEELGKELGGISVYYINHHWKEIRRRWLRKGYKLVKNGKGMSADYGILEPGASAVRFEYKGD